MPEFNNKDNDKELSPLKEKDEERSVDVTKKEEIESCLVRLLTEVVQKIEIKKPEIIYETSEIPREKDILEKMLPLAISEYKRVMANKELNFKDLRVVRILKDPQGNLLALNLSFPSIEGEFIQIEYSLAGRYPGVKAKTTTIESNEYIEKDRLENGEIAANFGQTLLDYENGQWISNG